MPSWECSVCLKPPTLSFSSTNNCLSDKAQGREAVASEANSNGGTWSQAQRGAPSSKYARNSFLRNAFRETSPAIEDAVVRKLNTPYVPNARQYPSQEATRLSERKSARIARVQVGFDMIWENSGVRVPKWTEILDMLKRLTPKRSEAPRMAAVRIVLPSSWDMSVEHRRVECVDASTGLTTRLRLSADHQNPSAVILRGESSALAKAADDLVRACPDVEIFKLGDVATFDYMAKRLWPSIADASDGALLVPPDKRHAVWLHKEMDTYWIEQPYEQTPKPGSWTKESLETYIVALVCGQLRPHLAMQFYKQPRQDGKLVDTNGKRVQLIMDALTDPSALPFITPPVLKIAIAFMSHAGGHLASADRMFSLAEEKGLPMDTELFNILLDGYVKKQDVTYFCRMLQKMESRYFFPDSRTWLSFLKLVQRDDERRQIVAAMYDLDLLDDPATRKGVAEIMASYDSYAAFRAGTSLDSFLADQATRYGEDWLTSRAVNHIAKEFFRFQGRSAGIEETPPSFALFMERQHQRGRKLELDTIHTILKRCIENRDWSTARWALSYMHEQSCEPDHQTYQLLISLAIVTRAPVSLGVILFYAILSRKLQGPARKSMQGVLLKRVLSDIPVKVFSKPMANLLKHNRIAHERTVVAGVEWAILSCCSGSTPVRNLASALDATWRTMDQPLHWQIRQKQQISTKPSATPDYAIKLRDSETCQQRIVHLDAQFAADTMIRGMVTESRPRRQDAKGKVRTARKSAASFEHSYNRPLYARRLSKSAFVQDCM